MKIKCHLSIILIFVMNGCARLQPLQSVSDKSLVVTNSSVIEYNRKLYRHWIDEDGDCQNTRAEVLIQNSLARPKFKTEKQCVVVSGKWLDPFSGKYLYSAKKIDIDHVWPLKAAHLSGADQWSQEKRKQFANDFENLLAVSARLNRQKGAKSPLSWMPPNKNYHCEYLKRWRGVQSKYKLKEPVRKPASLDLETLKNKVCEQ